eukprot:scaffold314446_cov30-Tisochrysis_lutea.AAC.3
MRDSRRYQRRRQRRGVEASAGGPEVGRCQGKEEREIGRKPCMRHERGAFWYSKLVTQAHSSDSASALRNRVSPPSSESMQKGRTPSSPHEVLIGSHTPTAALNSTRR